MIRGLLIAALTAASMLSGCANLPNPFSGKPAKADSSGAAASSAQPVAAQAEYRLEVQAPSAALRNLLLQYLDLARFQNAPASDGITNVELERLMLAAPAQARGLLETEGYFNAQVSVTRVGGEAASQTAATTATAVASARVEPGNGLGETAGERGAALAASRPDAAAGPPLLRLDVDPGTRATVAAATLEASGSLQVAAESGDAAAADELAKLRRLWSRQTGEIFRQPAWSEAKNSVISRLRADGYAAAAWTVTHAEVDALENRVVLRGALDSGPLYRLGPIVIDGLERYDAASVRNLATFGPGTPYSERLLLDFQERLQKVGLFEGASVVLDATPVSSGAAPVVVHVREMALQQATFGIGYSANTGPRLSVEHYHRRVFGTAWVARNKFELGPQNQSWTGELTSYPLEDLWRDLLGGAASRLKAADEIQTSASARIGRTQQTPRIERLYYAEVVEAKVDSSTLQTNARAISGNYHWTFRKVDDLLSPTLGTTLNAQLALGYGNGRRSTSDAVPIAERGPFSQAYARLAWYRPLPGNWYGLARIEAGQVFTAHPVAVPDTFLFRAGGEDSVRGYGYRTLGPIVDGAVAGGRTLLTGSIEVARPISPSYPDYLWALFVDGGNAADRWADIHPAYGYGAGLRWRSPVGPLRIDLAYGQQVHQVRVHFSVGVAF